MTRSAAVAIASLVLGLAACGSQTVRSQHEALPPATPKTDAAVAAAVADAAFVSEPVVNERVANPPKTPPAVHFTTPKPNCSPAAN